VTTRHRVAVIAGDGIGQEVVPAALECLERVCAHYDIELQLSEFDWGSDYYHRHGRMMAVDALDRLGEHEAIFLGAVGTPSLPDVETLWGMLIPIRRHFQQYINLRPVKTMVGATSPLTTDRSIDMVIVRENNEGEYSEVGGRIYRGLPQEAAIQEAVFTRFGITRVARFAADLARRRGGRVTSATKSNGIVHTMPFWDEIVGEVVQDYSDVTVESVLVDALAARMVLQPWSFDVIVASNLFGDILSDLGSALTGSIGVAPSANLNPEREHPSMFEPVHGSAPDIAGTGVANPVGQIWAGAMMLEHLGHPDAARHLISAFESVLASGLSTRDLGGTLSTSQFTSAVCEQIDVAATAA
jgi:tartrate dehydrogenase/decarboxylase / D-malate dehydrogenase